MNPHDLAVSEQQGAFYVLGEEIVRHLFASRHLLTLMSVEDAMVGLWLLGINKVWCRAWDKRDRVNYDQI